MSDTHMHLLVLAAIVLSPAFAPFQRTVQAAGRTFATHQPAPMTLDSLRERSRPLLLFAPNEKDPRLKRQIDLIAGDLSAMHERQVIVLVLVAKKEDRADVELQAIDQAELSAEDAAKARRQFRVGSKDFTVLLLGKDGGEKFRTHTPVTMERLNAVIDAMPMRQQEIRDGDSK